jgi:hypothetical protein
MKVCKKCHQLKELDEFYKKPKMADGHLNACIVCVKAYEKQRRLVVADHLASYEKARSNLPHRVQARKEYVQTEAGKHAKQRATNAYRARYPLKYAAHVLTHQAIKKGLLIPDQECAECGSTHKIEGHHDSYLEPLNVRWLCEACHKEWHRHHTPIYE